MKNFSPKNRIYLASVIAITATIVFTIGFFVSEASAISLCQEDETLTEFDYNSKPQSAFIDESSQNVVDQLCSECGCSYLSVDTSDGNPHYIYLIWDNLGDISGYENVLKFNLLLNHKENSTTVKVEFKNELDDWIEVCDPAETSSFIEDTCDLSPYFDTLKQVSPIELRVVAEKAGTCHEYLKCAKLDVELYTCEPPAPFCGDGIKNDQEECDGQDGLLEHYICTDQCTLEYVPYCGDQKCDSGEACDTCSQDCGQCPPVEYCGLYFNHVPDGVEFEGPITGLIPGDNPFNHPAWWDIVKLAFERNDSSLTFGNDFLPVDEGKDGDPFHFTVHWRALLNVSADGSYGYTLGSDDDSWLYIDDVLVEDLGGVHAPVTRNNSVYLTAGQHVFNLYFAERHTVQSYLYFEWTTPGIEVIAECEPYCGDGSCNGQENCETCSQDCGECPKPECGDGVVNQQNEECDDGNNVDGDGCSANCSIEIPVCDPNIELVKNGGFETPIVDTSQNWDIFTSSEINGWDVEWVSLIPSVYDGYDRPVNASLELQNSLIGWDAFEGNQYAELDSDWDGPGGSLSGEPASVKIYQDIPTIPGQNYFINFYFSPRPNTNADNNRLEFSWDGAMVANNITGAGENNTNWIKYEYTLNATSNTTRIQFADIGMPSDSLGTFLDKVSVRCQSAPPEPVCGNGILEGEEVCDNGTQNGQACTPACESECSYCSAICAFVTLYGSTCGRGGNGGGGGGGGGHVVVCGDGIRELDEQCDDGNKLDGDGCSSICKTELVAGASTEQQGEILGEATTRLPETGGNPLWLTYIGLIVAFGSAIGIKKLAFSHI